MADLSVQNTVAGQYASSHAAATTGAGVASAVPGRLCRLVVTEVGTTGTVIYDNSTAASGRILYALKASPAVGDIFDIQMPVANGIYVGGAAATSGFTLSYTKDSAYGR